MCSVPDAIAEIDTVVSHPKTGRYYWISQGTPELGWFNPDTCTMTKIGALSPAITDIAGAAFHPETNVLYANGKESGAIYKFAQDADGNPLPQLVTVVDNLPVEGESLAIQPKTTSPSIRTRASSTKSTSRRSPSPGRFS